MSVVHRGLASGRWQQLTLREQLAHIGSEISRALNWKAKGNQEYSLKAVDRAIELIILSLDGNRSRSQYKELARLHETVADYFYGNNQFGSTPALIRQYFDQFVFSIRR